MCRGPAACAVAALFAPAPARAGDCSEHGGAVDRLAGLQQDAASCCRARISAAQRWWIRISRSTDLRNANLAGRQSREGDADPLVARRRQGRQGEFRACRGLPDESLPACRPRGHHSPAPNCPGPISPAPTLTGADFQKAELSRANFGDSDADGRPLHAGQPVARRHPCHQVRRSDRLRRRLHVPDPDRGHGPVGRNGTDAAPGRSRLRRQCDQAARRPEARSCLALRVRLRLTPRGGHGTDFRST